MSSLLDGLLRDVEGVSLADLTQLDPSQQNGAALKFVQSALEVGVQYDQAAAVNAANTLGSYNALHASQIQQLDQYNTYMQTLTGERDHLAAQYSAASNEVNALQALSAAGTITPAQQKQLDEAVSQQASTHASLTGVNSLITGAGSAPTLSASPSVTGTSVQGPASGSSMNSSLSGFSDVLKNLPQGVQNNLSTALQSPSYPATKRLDNFITLLYERLAREISVLQDDLTRDPDNVAFLLQFDVGLYPSKKAKDHVARVEFNLDCPGCKVYSLYPGQSSYNLANYSGSSKRNTFWGNALTLIGLGVSASYRRQTDTLQGSLVQSVYVAGFQNGVLRDGHPVDHGEHPVDADQAEQNFGWYYGAAPFEQLVSPGIRSTFALITVPRVLIESTEDQSPFGNPDACLPIHIDAGWSSRNDPLSQDGYVSGAGKGAKGLAIPFYLPTHKSLLTHNNGSSQPKDETTPHDDESSYDPSVLTMQTSVKLPASLDDNSLVARREHKLHVLRMEYNTISEPADPVISATVIQTTVQMTQSTNPATGQTTGQTASKTTGTTVAAGNSAGSGGASNLPSALDPLPCPKGKCAALVIKLDRPIDPNLVVTVRGEPLQRVRDWRGRATSVLPPAQSGTDLAAAANTAGSPATKQLQQTRSLLESDQFAANTWFALNYYELLLNVSVEVATHEEFPVIQLADPSGSVIIPHDLRRSFTELIINGFRLRPQTERGIQKETGRQNWREDHKPYFFKKDAPISSGPYAFSTFLPLFSPPPAPRGFFAMVGETGNDLLIGFLPRRVPQKAVEQAAYYDWLETKTQVILEDRNLDFAWSLSCDVQGELLACRVPREEISRVYWNFLRACPNETECPGLDTDRQSLVQSLEDKVRSQEKAESPTVESREVVKQTRANLLESNSDFRDFRNAFVSTMQVSIEQSDEEGKNVFYSPEPVRIGFLPLSDDYWSDTPFKAWEFEHADANSITLDECNYLPNVNQCNINVSVLGIRSWPDWLSRSSAPGEFQHSWARLASGNDEDQNNSKCGTFAVPTAALAYDPLVFVMATPTHPPAPSSSDALAACTAHIDIGNQGKNLHDLRTIITIPKSRLAPRFKEPRIRSEIKSTQSTEGKPPLERKVWEVQIPVENSVCGDEVDLPREMLRADPQKTKDGKSNPPDYTKIGVEWRNGNDVLTCPSGIGADRNSPKFKAWAKADQGWRAADMSERINLHLEIPRQVMNDFPDRVDMVRTTSEGVKWVVATLPNLRRLLLPSRLTLDPLGPRQFALRGNNAEVIDAVALQNGTAGEMKGTTFQTARGVDFALVTLPAPSASTPNTDASSASAGGNSSTQITIDTTKDNADHVKMTTQSSSTPAKATASGNKPPVKPSPDDKTAGPKPLAPGSYAVIPLVQVGSLPADQSKPNAKATTAAGKAGAAKPAPPTPIYMPLNVTDEKGKPLIFTIADSKKSSTAPSSTSTPAPATCITPCVTTPCAVSCQQTPAQPAAPKGQ